MKHLRRIAGQEEYGSFGVPALSTRLILKEAEKHGVSWKSIPDSSYFALKYNGHTEYFKFQISSLIANSGRDISNHKGVANSFLREAGVNTSLGYTLLSTDSEDYFKTVFSSLAKPVVIKPVDGTHGNDVFVGIKTLKRFLSCIETILQKSKKDIVRILAEEQFVNGDEYRILCTRERVIGVTYRVPANVIGDGKHTIQELIDIKNQDPNRGDAANHTLITIEIDDNVVRYLKEQSQTIESVPQFGQQVFLRRVSNLCMGGDSIDYTDRVHDSVNNLALQAIRAIPGLEFAGIDFMSRDITAPQTPESYVIIEVNYSPGFAMHDHPADGKERCAAENLLYTIFPELKL